MDTTPVDQMKTEALLPAHVDLDREIAAIRARQGEIHAEITRREQEARMKELAARPANFPPTQGIGIGLPPVGGK